MIDSCYSYWTIISYSFVVIFTASIASLSSMFQQGGPSNDDRNYASAAITYLRTMGESVETKLGARLTDYLNVSSGPQMIRIENLYDKLPTTLQEEACYHIAGNMLLQSPVFNKFSFYVLRDLAKIMKQKFFNSRRIIISEGDIVDGIYFLRKGKFLICFLSDPKIFERSNNTDSLLHR